MRPRLLMTTAVYARSLTALRAAAGLAAVFVLAFPAAGEAAKQTSRRAIWGPAQVGAKSQFPIYRDLGVGIYQPSISGADVATQRPANPTDPADPAYDW